MRDETLPLNHFEAIYARGSDPWHFATSAYEQAKYAATLAALPRERYASAFEVGCSIGVLTALLAMRCDRLLAVEPVVVALDAARRRNADAASVVFAPMFVPASWPDETFDLIVLSEVLDYLGDPDVARIAARVVETLRPGGDVVLVHWLGKKKDPGPQQTEASSQFVAAASKSLVVTRQERNPDYRLDVLRRAA